MSEPIVPESRIFRIGRECYVVYLGKERDDFRPFLRIGNARDIPDEVHEVLSTTVVTDDHVGNPLIEILLAPKFQGRYLGDTGVVATIRRFFKSFDLPTDDVTDYRKVKDGERRHMVWFYSSGNIHLRYDERVIFDLDKREKEDRHFVRLYEEAKSEFLRNPLRYIRQDFSGQGVVLSHGNGFWYEAGELLSFAAHPGFVAKLMGDGVDPDFITASAYNLTSDQMDSRDAAVFIGFVKRMRQRKKQLRVISSHPELLRKLKLLFPERGEIPATLDVTDVSGKRKATFRDSIVSRKDDKWLLHRAGLPEMAFGSEMENGLSIDFVKRRISFNTETVQAVFAPPAGFPIDFIGHNPPETQMMDKYVAYTLTNVKDHLSNSEVQAVTVLERYLKMLRDDINAKKTSVSPLLKQIGGNARDALRHCSPNQGGPSWFFFSNVTAILGFLKKRIGAEHGLYKSADHISSSLDILMAKLPSPDPVLPFWGDLYLGDVPCLLWRASKRGFVPADIVSARETDQKIADIANLDESPWKEDSERLLRLISSLSQGGQGPLTEEQLAILSQPEKNKGETEKKDQKKTVSTDQIKLRTPETSAGSAPSVESITDKKSTTGKSGNPRRTWPWLLLLLLLLLGGALIWDLSGNAPWGSIIQESDKAAAAEKDNQSEAAGIESNESGNSGSGDSNSSETSAADNSKTGSTESGKTDNGKDETGENTSGNNETTESENQTAAVDSDVAPKSLDEVKAYLDVNGRVAITEVDIHLAANEIAVLNGYKDLDYRVFTGEDPNWIFPGRILNMPGTGDYTIKRGDTIWFLAAREVRIDAENNMKIYDNAVLILDDNLSDAAKKKDAADNLRKIADIARAAALRKMASNALTIRDL